MEVRRLPPEHHINIISPAVFPVPQMHGLMNIRHQVDQKLEGFFSRRMGSVFVRKNYFEFPDFFSDTFFFGTIPHLVIRPGVLRDIGVMFQVMLSVPLLDRVRPIGDIGQIFYVKLLSNNFPGVGREAILSNDRNNTMPLRPPGIQGFNWEHQE